MSFNSRPRGLLHVVGGTIVKSCNLRLVPEWAKPMFVAAMEI